jgi:diguanylate cyclase
MPALIPDNELFRLNSLVKLNVLDSPPEVEFDAIAHAAAEACGVSIGLISLIDKDRQWFKANVGLPGTTETPRDQGFCAHAIYGEDILEIEDATRDARFYDSPLVTSAPHIRFYAGTPLTLSDGANIGTLCVIGDKPNKLTKVQRSILRLLAKVTVKALEARRALQNEQLTTKQLSQLSFRLLESENRFRVLSESSPVGIFSTDQQGKCTYTNQRWQEIFDMDLETSLGDGWQIGLHPDDLEDVFTTWKANALLSKEFYMEFRTKNKNGLIRHVHSKANPIIDPENKISGFVGTVEDVTEQRRLISEVNYRATHDALTGLINRTEFELRLQKLLHKSYEDKSEHALMFIDLDQFKIVNDTCGHSVGDQVLQQVSKLLNEVVRTRDTLARLGGDEFAIILEHCSTDQAHRVAQEICEKMDNFRFLHDLHRFRIGTSIGLVSIDNRWVNTESLIQAADNSCYAAKEAGRNRVHVWFDTDQAIQLRRSEMEWTSRIESALDEHRFELFAQRIYDLKAVEQGLHVEVLLRMKDTDGAIISPRVFMLVAERFHLATRIDRWVLRSAITWLKDNQAEASTINMLSINFSGQSIGDSNFHRQAIGILTEAGNVLCSKLCIEITETAAITNLSDASLFIEQLHGLGIKVALDDFGAGVSSFGYLKQLGIDILKIDGQFIRDIVDDPLHAAAVRCFVDVANLIGLKTVAEFVDKPEVLARVKELGIDYSQGFLMHTPEPICLAAKQHKTKTQLRH